MLELSVDELYGKETIDPYWSIVYEDGQLVISGTMKLNAGMDNSINLPGSVAKGYYILQLVGEKINYTQKILVQ